jgi:hypothetical protein
VPSGRIAKQRPLLNVIRDRLKVIITLGLTAKEASTVIECMLRGSRSSTVPVPVIDSAVRKIEAVQEMGGQVTPRPSTNWTIFQCVNTLRGNN